MNDERPLLTLVMVVKNDARTVAETVASARPFIDRYAVVDVGSTDGTQDRLREAFGDLPGDLVEAATGTSHDCAELRNQALVLAGNHARFTLFLEPHEVLVDGAALRAFAESQKNAGGPHHGAYLLRIHEGALRADAPRLVRAGSGWHYVGAAMPTLIKEKAPSPSVRVTGAHLDDDPSRGDQKALRARHEADAHALQEEAKRRPKDPHVAFALAVIYERLGDPRRAFSAFERRSRLGGRQEEVYESLLRMARHGRAVGRPWGEVQQLALDAYSHSPHRAEPLYFIAWHYYERKNWPLTFLFAARGAGIPYPERAGIAVDADVYAGKLDDLVGTAAFYVGEFAAGEAALRRALERQPGDERLQRNLAFYESKAKQAAAQGEGRQGQRGAKRPPNQAGAQGSRPNRAPSDAPPPGDQAATGGEQALSDDATSQAAAGAPAEVAPAEVERPSQTPSGPAPSAAPGDAPIDTPAEAPARGANITPSGPDAATQVAGGPDLPHEGSGAG